MKVEYAFANDDQAYPRRTVETSLSADRVDALERDGFLVLERLLDTATIAGLGDALDRLVEREAKLPHGSHEVVCERRFGGHYYQDLYRKDEAFAPLLRLEPLLSIARIMLGPLVSTRPLSARITDDTCSAAETHWHQHLVVAPRPLPRWYMRAHSLEALVYLDDITAESGALALLPGSHERIHGDLPGDVYGPLPGERLLTCPAGSVVLMHGALWHRALPATAGPFGRRRMLMLAYQPAWLKRRSYSPSETVQPTAAGADGTDLAELLGTRGYN